MIINPDVSLVVTADEELNRLGYLGELEGLAEMGCIVALAFFVDPDPGRVLSLELGIFIELRVKLGCRVHGKDRADSESFRLCQHGGLPLLAGFTKKCLREKPVLLEHIDAFLAVFLEKIFVLQKGLHLHDWVGVATTTRSHTGLTRVVKEGKKAVVVFL